MRVPSPTMAVIEMPWLERKYEPWKPVEVTSTMPPIPVEADAPPDLVTPLTASAAASDSQARRSSSAVDGMLGSSRSRSGKSRASNEGSARPTYLSSGATRAMATARSASLATPSPLTSLVEITAWRRPTSTRNPTSSPSERSDSSTRPSRTSTPCETLRTATASAASAPALLAASTRRCASALRADWSNRSDVADFEAGGDAADGEEITNKSQRLKEDRSSQEYKSLSPADVLDSHALQAFLARESQRISRIPQPLVNHVSQGPVNHAS